jgi:hypothetical protein
VWLSRVRLGSVGCGVAQLAVRRLAVRQAQVRFSARHLFVGSSLAERRNDEDTRRRASANGEG